MLRPKNNTLTKFDSDLRNFEMRRAEQVQLAQSRPKCDHAMAARWNDSMLLSGDWKIHCVDGQSATIESLGSGAVLIVDIDSLLEMRGIRLT